MHVRRILLVWHKKLNAADQCGAISKVLVECQVRHPGELLLTNYELRARVLRPSMYCVWSMV